MSDTVRESLNNLDRLFLDALVAGEYDAAAGIAFVGGFRIQRARMNHALVEGHL